MQHFLPSMLSRVIIRLTGSNILKQYRLAPIPYQRNNTPVTSKTLPVFLAADCHQETYFLTSIINFEKCALLERHNHFAP